jgi:hypothetical protein
MQGISPNQPLFREIRLGNLSEFRDLRENSLRAAQGIFSRAQGIFAPEQRIWREVDPRHHRQQDQ